MKVKEIFEAKYSGHGKGEWAEVLDWVGYRPDKLQEFVKNNQKILKEVFTLMKSSFRMFYDMTIDYMDDIPEDYDEEDRDPEKIASYWWDMFPQDMEEEPLWQQASAKIGGPEYGDTVRVFGLYITENAKRIAQYNHVFEARYVHQHVDRDLPSYHKMSDREHAQRVLKNPKVKHKGSGAFASTYQHQDRPHDVTKITKPMEFPDGYQKYLRMLLQHEDKDNPYFPKIRDVKERRRGEANTMAIRMEALKHIQTLSHKEANTILDKWLGKNKERVLANSPGRWVNGIPKMTSDEFYGRALVKVLRDLFNYYEGDVEDKNLQKAMKWIKYTVATDGVELDIGDNNVMVRRTPYGAQIVFTDPVA